MRQSSSLSTLRLVVTTPNSHTHTHLPVLTHLTRSGRDVSDTRHLAPQAGPRRVSKSIGDDARWRKKEANIVPASPVKVLPTPAFAQRQQRPP